jgi:hypothetical protein
MREGQPGGGSCRRELRRKRGRRWPTNWRTEYPVGTRERSAGPALYGTLAGGSGVSARQRNEEDKRCGGAHTQKNLPAQSSHVPPITLRRVHVGPAGDTRLWTTSLTQ